MSKIFSKKDINNIILKETKGYYILNKKDLKLNENGRDNAYVEGSGNDMSNMATDLRDAQTNNPTAKEFVVNANSYNGNSSNKSVTLNVQGDNPTDATKNFQQITRNPAVRNLMNHTNVNAKIDLGRKDEGLDTLIESSVPFTKKEIREMFKK